MSIRPSIRIIKGLDGYKAMYDSVTMTAFGPIFYEDDDAEDFLNWFDDWPLPPGFTLLTLNKRDLSDLVHKWRKEKHPEKYKK